MSELSIPPFSESHWRGVHLGTECWGLLSGPLTLSEQEKGSWAVEEMPTPEGGLG